MKDNLAPYLPLSSAAVHILLSLAAEPRHGYAIMQEIARQSTGQYKIGPGTLYDNLEKLLEKGMVSEAGSDRSNEDPRRRYYQLTAFGRKVLAADIERLKNLVRQAGLRLHSPAARKGR